MSRDNTILNKSMENFKEQEETVVDKLPKIERWGPFIIDWVNKRLILDDEWELYTKESFRIKSEKHIKLSSGQTLIPGKEHLNNFYSIWFNSDTEDNLGNPISFTTETDQEGN